VILAGVALVLGRGQLAKVFDWIGQSGQVNLTVISTPSGAQVYVGSDSIGTTPITKRSTTVGTRTLRLTLPGYVDYRGKLDLEAGGETTVTVTLKKNPVTPSTAALTVTSTPSGAQVYLNGKDMQKMTPWTLTLVLGTYKVNVVKEGYVSQESPVQLTQAGTTKTLPVTLPKNPATPTTATLTVTSTPSGAQVYVGSYSIGTTPITNKTVTPGTRTVLVTLAGYEDYHVTVTLQAGMPKTVTAPLTRSPATPTTATLTVTSTPSGARVFLDGTSIGTTPITNKTVNPGTYSLLLSLVGYQDYPESVTLLVGTTKTLPVTLTKVPVTPTTATLTVTSTPSGAQVYVGSYSIGTTPITNRTANPGTYSFVLTLAGYEDYHVTVTLQAGMPKGVTAVLTRTVQTSRWTSVFAGQVHSLALASDGSLWAWGSNQDGQLGDGTTANRSTPVPVGTSTTWRLVAAGATHTLAVASDGSLWAWGSNEYGQLGDGTGTSRSTPVRVGASSDWTSVAAGQGHSLALTKNGTLWAWGQNGDGQVGDGTGVNRSTPVRVGTRSDWTAIASGGFHCVARTSDGSLWAWGWNRSGQLGDGTTASRLSPTRMATWTTWRTLAAGQEHSLAVAGDGSLWAWGSNQDGQLGDGTTIERSTPIRVGTRTDWTFVAAGAWHSLAITREGSLWTCGDNWSGQLGDGTTTNRESLVRVGTSTGWTVVAGGEKHSLAVRDGSLWSWGDNERGQLGNGKTGGSYSNPVSVSPGG
jgi:alpha-tubulin suppressor-like RCC1 family protein